MKPLSAVKQNTFCRETNSTEGLRQEKNPAQAHRQSADMRTVGGKS
jgi:hypothetical protein